MSFFSSLFKKQSGTGSHLFSSQHSHHQSQNQQTLSQSHQSTPQHQTQRRNDKIITMTYLDLHDNDTINLFMMMRPLQQIDIIVLTNVHSTLLKEEAIIKKIQLNHPHLHPHLSTFKKELPRTIIFSKFTISESIPFPTMPTVFARKSEIECQIVRISTEDINPNSSLCLVIFNLDSKVNEKVNTVIDYQPVTTQFIKQYEMNLIHTHFKELSIPYPKTTAILYCGNFHEKTVIDVPITLGSVDTTKLNKVINEIVLEKESIVDGTPIIEKLNKNEIPVKKALGMIYDKCKEYTTISAAIIAEAVSLSISEYIQSSVRLLSYKEIGKRYVEEEISAMNLGCKLWGFYNIKVERNEPIVASFLNRINKTLEEMNIPIDIETTEIHFGMFILAIQRWLQLKLKSSIVVNLLSRETLREISVNDIDCVTENCFPDFSSSKLKDSQKINGNFINLCYANNLTHLGSLVEGTNEASFLPKESHICTMSNYQNTDVTQISPFASVQCLHYSALPSSTIQLLPNVDGLFVRFGVYPQI